MQGILTAFFALGMVVALIGGIAGLIDPSTFRFGQKVTPSRKQVAVISVGAFIASFIGLGVSAPKPTPEEMAKRAAAAAKAEAEEKAAEEAKAKVKAAQAVKAKAAEQTALRQGVIALWDEISENERPCANSLQETAAALERGNAYDAYDVASNGRHICRDAYFSMGKIAPPKQMKSDHRDGFKDAIEKCADTQLARKIALESMLVVIDGDQRPSAVQEARDAAETAQAGVALCVLAFMEAANAVDVSIGDYVKDRK